MRTTLVAALFSTLFSIAGCDGVDDEGEFSDLEIEPNESNTHPDDALHPVEEIRVGLNPAEAPSGGLTVPPARRKCCVNCQGDGKKSWYTLASEKGECNANGKLFCHMNNWDFGNAEWYFHCPKK
jgi:hypothetical protein